MANDRVTNTRAAEVRDLGDDELVTRLREAKEELFNLRFQVATGQLDNNRRLHTVRKDIARIYTVMRERELGIVRAASTPDGDVTAPAAAETAAEADAPTEAEAKA
jgi:large subunit ribosomal protein L29